MTRETRIKANNLQKEINKMEYFLKTIDPSKNIQRGSGSWNIDVVVKTRTTKETSIFGSRYFGGGSHKEEIDFPNELMSILYEICSERVTDIQSELDSL